MDDVVSLKHTEGHHELTIRGVVDYEVGQTDRGIEVKCLTNGGCAYKIKLEEVV